MYKIYCRVVLFLLLFACPALYAQQKAAIYIYDTKSKHAVPFATVKFGESGHGLVTGLDGEFELPAEYADGSIKWIEVSSLGYKAQKINLPLKAAIYLQPQGNTLNEVVVKPPYEKMRRILDLAIANKNRNNPDKYDWYRCHVYYKMTGDMGLPDSVMNDTSARNREKQDFINSQHLFLSETYSIRTWKKPQKLQEDVLATRISGFNKSMFTSLVTDVLPFHTYNDYITLNGKDYHNPVSKGYERYYRFNLVDEIMQGRDTVWILSFAPKGRNTNELKGSVYINSAGYAISQIIARAYDTSRKFDVRIEQQYEQVPVAGGEARWFPKHLNYIIDWKQETKTKNYEIFMKGNSIIDSVTWQEDPDFKFDKTHTVRLQPKADERNDTTWKTLRPEALNAKEITTYKVMDSLGEKVHLDKIMTYMSRLPEGKVPVGIFDFDVARLFSYNYYENVRLGLGVQTNEKLVKWLSVGGWAGYGFGDAHWKYGGFAEVYADRRKEFVFRAGYTDDISDPGRIHLNRDLDKNYLRSYLLQRVDETKAWTASVKKKTGYWNWELSATNQQITPKYQYALEYKNTELTTFTANEASLSFRYAYAERTAPFFGYYYSLGSRYPMVYGRITTGSLESGPMQTPYTQAVGAVAWHKHINRWGYEHILLEGGKSWSDGNLPLSKLFAGNGFRYNTTVWDNAIYAFGGMITMYPYGYYTDQYVNFIFRHDIDWKLYKFRIPKTQISSAPYISVQYGMLLGTLSHPGLQRYVNFAVPDNAYHEGGLLLNNLVRLQYLNLYYVNLNIGYFYHIAPAADISKNGRFVFGISVDL